MVALDLARRRARGLIWEDARPALDAAGLLPPTAPPAVAILPLTLYRLAVLRARDSAAFEATRERLSRGGQASAQVAEAVVTVNLGAAITNTAKSNTDRMAERLFIECKSPARWTAAKPL